MTAPRRRPSAIGPPRSARCFRSARVAGPGSEAAAGAALLRPRVALEPVDVRMYRLTEPAAELATEVLRAELVSMERFVERLTGELNGQVTPVLTGARGRCQDLRRALRQLAQPAEALP